MQRVWRTGAMRQSGDEPQQRAALRATRGLRRVLEAREELLWAEGLGLRYRGLAERGAGAIEGAAWRAPYRP